MLKFEIDGWPITMKIREDKSLYFTAEGRPGFHFIMSDAESVGQAFDALVSAFRHFCQLYEQALAARGEAI